MRDHINLHYELMDKYKETDEFLRIQAEADPERWAELEEEFPTLTIYDNIRAKIGEPISRKRKRDGPSGGVPKSKQKRLTDADWKLAKRNKERYLRDHAEEMRYAKELADSGM